MHKYQTILVVYMVNHAQRKREFGSSNLDGGGSLHQGEDGHPLCGGASRFDAYRIQYVAYSALHSPLSVRDEERVLPCQRDALVSSFGSVASRVTLVHLRTPAAKVLQYPLSQVNLSNEY